LLFPLQCRFALSVLLGFHALNEDRETCARNVMIYRKPQTEDVTFHEGRLYLACLLHPVLHLNAELNAICHLLALLEAHHILHVSR